MNSNSGYSSGFYLLVKRALEGRVTPLTFLLILGFFSTLVLLYISLHVYFFNISNEISTSSERVDALMDANVRLMASYNVLASPGRIIPMARELGMRAGATEEVHRLALRIGAESDQEEPSWAQLTMDNLLEFTPFHKPGTK
jgi:cell division protein FtsL